MPHLPRKLTIGILSAALIATSFLPANAMSIPKPAQKPAQVSTDVEAVQWRDRRGWYGGHRGYRDYRPGYRRHNGFWFPLAAFGLGAAIAGGAMAAPPRRSYSGSSHVEWCASRYRTYRAYDNTYVPRAGFRAQCVSPY